MKTIVYLAHPRPDRSEISTPLFKVAQNIEGVTCVDLYAEYPAFDIDVPKEQQRLVEHDAIIMLHPLYWYSTPALLKEWIDLVFEHGFAYGQSGHALDDKILINTLSAGATEDAYSENGANGADIRSLLIPIETTANLCRMHYLAPHVLFGAGRATEQGRDKAFITQFERLLTHLQEDTLDLSAAKTARTLNSLLEEGAN